jgi:hypothetical protein
MALTELKQSMIQPDANLILRASAAETADAFGTGILAGPFKNGKVSVLCSAGFATGTIQFTIQQSSVIDGSGDAYTDAANQLVLSPVITGASTLAGSIIWQAYLFATKKYVRIGWVNETASGAVSKTFQALLDLSDAGK